MKEVHIYTDGSSRGNPGPSGWASVIFKNTEVVELGGRTDHGTNNQMELQAVVSSLLYIEDHKMFDMPISIFIDSAYVQKGITMWMYGWDKNGWQTSTGDPVSNKDLWEQALYVVFRLKNKVKIIFEKVAGHADVFGNERADTLATSFADNIPTPLFHGEKATYIKLFENTKKKTVTTKSKKNPSKKAYSYVSCVDGDIHIDSDWEACSKRVTGKKGARYKKSFSKEEEENIIHEFKKSH